MQSVTRVGWKPFIAVAGVCVVVAGLVTPVAPAAPARAATTTYVSLTFDDALASQLNAAALLDANGVRGTFYVNSGFLGAGSRRLTLSQLRAMQASGHEIGGHTLDHADLTTVSTGEATRQICADQAQLQAWGFPAISFAYPGGHSNGTVEAIVKDCKSRGYTVATNYRSGRTVSGLQGSGQPQAESVPPANPYRVREAGGSPTNATTLADLQEQVTNAESTGGWLPFSFHSVCQAPATAPVPGDAADCTGTYTTAYDLLDQFVKWLKARSSQGTIIKTTAEVVGLVANPSFETDANADGAPDCFRLDGYGTNNYSYARVTGGHTGTYAERLRITSLTSGDRKVSTGRNAQGAACTMPATTGKTYTVSGWYTATGPVRFVAYYRDAGGVWVTWTTGPYSPAVSAWTKITWTTPAMPAGADIWSFGLALNSVGTMTVDDYSAAQT